MRHRQSGISIFVVFIIATALSVGAYAALDLVMGEMSATAKPTFTMRRDRPPRHCLVRLCRSTQALLAQFIHTAQSLSPNTIRSPYPMSFSTYIAAPGAISSCPRSPRRPASTAGR